MAKSEPLLRTGGSQTANGDLLSADGEVQSTGGGNHSAFGDLLAADGGKHSANGGKRSADGELLAANSGNHSRSGISFLQTGIWVFLPDFAGF